jgi:carboxymethylenebutenolidase
MKEDTPQISIATADGGSFAAYLALPETTPAPAVICIQEVYGVNRFMRAITDFWASQGFVAISPDIYWRLRSGVEFDPEVEGDGDRAMALASELDRGYCLGGLLSYLIGTRHDADCNIGYYPVGIENFLDEAERLNRPIMLHIGESDPYTPPEARAQLATALGSNALATIHCYPDIGHAFARPGAPSHVPQAADLANERSAAFFRKHLA